MKIVSVIEKFDGCSDAAKWLERFEAAAVVCGLDRKDWAAVMPIMVSGAAHDVYSQWSDITKKDYELTKKALLTAFSLDPTTAYLNLKDRTLQRGESVEAFCADIRRLAGLVFGCSGTASLIDPLVRVALLDGLPAEISVQLRTNPGLLSGDVNDLLQAATAIIPSSRSKEAFGAASVRRNYRRQPTCFRCHEEGHIQRNCPTATDRLVLRCFGCQEVGHRRSECPHANPKNDQGGRVLSAPRSSPSE